jgi:hypothetical protein
MKEAVLVAAFIIIWGKIRRIFALRKLVVLFHPNAPRFALRGSHNPRTTP